MLDQPQLPVEAARSAVQTHYNLSVTSVTFLPIGNDLASFVYRVEAADGASYFLKARANAGFRAASLLIPRYLHERGVPHVVAPIPTKAQALWTPLDGFALSLYPLIDARPAADVGLSQQHWHALGATLRLIHTTPLPAALAQLVPREAYVPSRRHVPGIVEQRIANERIDGPYQRELAAFWLSRRQQIARLFERADVLGEQLRQKALPPVLCHADIHTWNVLLDADQAMWIVDWDETVLAPKERDLMFVVGGIGRNLIRPHETTAVLQGYGDPTIDDDALCYYRYAWAAQDIAAYAEAVFLAPELGDGSRRAAVDGFIDLFAPGNIVDIADESAGSHT